MLMKKQGLLIAEALVAFATRQTPTDRSCPKFWFEQHPAFATDIRRKDHPPFWPGRHYAVHAVHPIRHESSAEPQYFHIGRGIFILFLTPQQFSYNKPAVSLQLIATLLAILPHNENDWDNAIQ